MGGYIPSLPNTRRTRRSKAIPGAAVAALLPVLLLLPAPADSAVHWWLRGAGYGHGVGMSQYGAYGYAKHGTGYREILGHYYENTEIGRRDGVTVRVLLEANQSQAAVRGGTHAAGRSLDPASTYKLTRDGDSVVLRSASGRRLATAPGVITVAGGKYVRLSGTAQNGLREGLYRGALEIRAASGSGLNVINALGIEPYVQGVVPSESPPSWPAAALEAQAVAARSYALATSVSGKGFDQYADTRSQVYRGYLSETPATNAAAAHTRGEVVTYKANVAVTYFFSTSGGYTENVENVFMGGHPEPWLKGVADPYDDASPYHRWGPYGYTSASLEAKLGSWVKGEFEGIDVLKRGVSPRVVRASVLGSKGATTVTGPQIRARLGLRDTWFYLRRASSDQSGGAHVHRTSHTP